jgi:IS66 C-terminal element/Transposase IS66 family
MFTHVAARTVRCPPIGVFSRSASGWSESLPAWIFTRESSASCQGTHTNTVERAMRPVALGRKNALFAGSNSGGKHWAIIATLIQSAKLNDVDPLAWLTDVLERIVSGRTKRHELDTLLPWNWKAAKAAEAHDTT